MPIYDYRCDHCGHAFSQVQSFSDEPLSTCPKCGKRPRRLMSAPAIVFKGSGWYATDSRNASEKAEAKADAKSEKSEKSEKGETKDAGTKTETAAKVEPSSGAKPAADKPKPAPKTEAAS